MSVHSALCLDVRVDAIEHSHVLVVDCVRMDVDCKHAQIIFDGNVRDG